MDNIPKEIYSIIASFLDDASKRTMRLASTQWFNIIKYDSFDFYYTTEEQFEEICNQLKKYRFPIGVGFPRREFVFEKRHYNMLGQLTQLTRLSETWIYKGIPLDRLWGLTNLTNLEEIDGDVPVAILQHLPNLKLMEIRNNPHLQVSQKLSKLESIVYLDIDGAAVSEYIKEDLQSLSNPLKLTNLKCVGNSSEQKLDLVNDQLERLSNLKKLSMVDASWSEGQEVKNNWNIPTLPNLEALLVYGLENIHSISLSNTKLSHLAQSGDNINCSNFTSCTNMKDLMLSGKVMTNLSGLGSLTKLKSLTISFTTSSEPFCSMEDFQFLSHLPNLESFNIGVNPSSANWNEAMKYFPDNNNLTEVLFRGSNKILDHHAPKFHKLQKLSCNKIDMESIDHMTALTNLTTLYVSTMSPTIFQKLSNLTSLKYFTCNNISLAPFENPNSNITKLDFGKLVKMEFLSLSDDTKNGPEMLFSGFHELTRLTYLNVPLPNKESVFAEILLCTSLVELRLSVNISDDQILKLTSLTSLRRLSLLPEGVFTGVHLTCLTGLRSVVAYSPQLMFTPVTLRQKLPNLRVCTL